MKNKSILAVLALSVLVVSPVKAQETATPKTELPSSVADERGERLALSRELHDIKRVKDRVLADIETLSQSLPLTEREDFKKYMELNVDFDALEQKSIEYAADIYTVPELKAMIAYFGSDVGRSAEAKGEEYGAKFGSDVQKEIDKAIMAAKFDKIEKLPQSTPTIDMLGR